MIVSKPVSFLDSINYA